MLAASCAGTAAQPPIVDSALAAILPAILSIVLPGLVEKVESAGQTAFEFGEHLSYHRYGQAHGLLTDPSASRVTVGQLKNHVEQAEAQFGALTGWALSDSGICRRSEFGWYAEFCASFEHGSQEGGIAKLVLDLDG